MTPRRAVVSPAKVERYALALARAGRPVQGLDVRPDGRVILLTGEAALALNDEREAERAVEALIAAAA